MVKFRKAPTSSWFDNQSKYLLDNNNYINICIVIVFCTKNVVIWIIVRNCVEEGKLSWHCTFNGAEDESNEAHCSGVMVPVWGVKQHIFAYAHISRKQLKLVKRKYISQWIFQKKNYINFASYMECTVVLRFN